MFKSKKTKDNARRLMALALAFLMVFQYTASGLSIYAWAEDGSEKQEEVELNEEKTEEEEVKEEDQKPQEDPKKEEPEEPQKEPEEEKKEEPSEEEPQEKKEANPEEEPRAGDEPEEEEPKKGPTRGVDDGKITVTFDPTTDPDEQQEIITIEVDEGTAIGNQLPTVPEVPGYRTKWVVKNTETEVTKETVVTEPFEAVVDQSEKITYTVTFVQEDGTEDTRTTDIDSGFAINDLPEVAPKANKVGKWVYPGTTNEFTVGTVISENLTVNAYYEQNIFTVTFMVDDAQYEEMTTATGTTIVLPSDPIKAGTTFKGWFTEPDGKGTQYTAESTVNEDLTLYAYFEGQVTVKFLVKDDNGDVISAKSQYFIDLQVGDHITTLPDEPFIEGKVFDHWEHETKHTPVEVGTTVNESFNAVAVFKAIDTYELTVNYFYKNDNNERVDIGTQVYDLVEGDFPYTVTAPGFTVAYEVTDDPTYYPSQPTITVNKNQFTKGADGKYTLTVEDEFVAADAEYKVGHYLKKLNGEGYDQIEIVDKVGVKNSKVTPDINNYPYAEYDHRDENVTINDDPDQELKVYYDRRDFTLSYNVGGGDYIEAVTAPYKTEITLPTTARREGYTFAGWYKDADCTQSAGTSITLEENTTLYAKWNAAQVNYQIVYMIENANDDDYSYLATVRKQAATDSEITMTAQTAGANGTRPSDLDTTNFTFKDSTTETVKADGTTVVTVRYSRNVYTLQGRYNNGNVSGANLQAKYGADITAQWSRTFGSGNNAQYSWSYNNQNDSKFKSLTIMPSLSVRTNNSPANTIYLYRHSDSANYYQHLEYWLQNYTEGDATTTHNGKTYGRVKSIDMRYNYLSNVDDWYEITGYSKAGYTAEHRRYQNTGTWQSFTYTWGRQFSQYGNQYTYTRFNFYYDAEDYPLTFYNYNGELISTQDVTLGNDISSYLTSNVPNAPMEGAVWKGWYTDPEHSDGTEYSGGTKMPAGLVLYGDFEFPTRTVTFDSQGGTEVAPQTDEYGFYATMPANPTKDHYSFQGWFTAADETGSYYDWNQPVTEDITLYAHWTQDPISYTVHYYEKGTTTKVLDDKVVSDPNFTEGQSITENAPTVAGHVADEGSKSIELSFDEENNTIIFYYDAIPNELTYTVNYVLRDNPEIKVAESKIVTVPGSTTNAMEMAVEVNKVYLESQTSDPDIIGKHYKPVNASQELQLGLENNVITFEYIPYTTSKITVNYLDMDGKPIHATDTTYVEKGDTFTVQNKAPEGYVYHHAYLDGTTTAPQATYQITGNEGNLVINIYYQRKLIIIANNKAKTYDGTALYSSFENSSDWTVVGDLRGDFVSGLEFDGSQTNAGTSATTPKNAQITKGVGALTDPETYYSIIYVPGSLTVKPVSVYISVSADQWNTHSGGSGPNYYTGQTFNVGFTNPNKQHFNDASGSAYVSITSGQRALFKEKYGDAIWSALYGDNGALISEKDAGTYTVTGAQQRTKIAAITVDGQSMMSDPNYSITLYARDSFLKIEPLPLTITTPSDEKAYDGTALTKSEGATLDHSYWTANIGGTWTAAETAGPGSVTLGTGETITFNVTGSQTPVGSSENTYAIDWGDNKASNYKINATLGTLTVTSGTLKVTVKDIEKVYNGEEQKGRSFVDEAVIGTGSTISTDDYIIEGLGKNDVLTITYTPAKGTNVNTYSGSFATDYSIVNAAGEDVTSNYGTKTFTPGNLTITPASVTLTATSGHLTYSGSEQSISGYTPSVEGLTFSGVSAEGKGTNAGNYDVTFTGVKINQTRDTTGNYVVTEVVNGTLTIDPKPVTITAQDKAFTYTGEAQSWPKYDVDGLVPGDAISAVVEGSITFPSESPVTNKLKSYQFTTGNSNNYTVTTKDGKLTMTNASVAITITASDGEWPYDGRAHSNNTVTVTSGELLEGDELVATATGSVTNVAETADGNNPVAAGYKIMHGEEDVSANYVITPVAGTLTINPKAVTITAQDKEFTYTGEAQSWPKYDVEGLVGSDAITAVVEGSITFPSEGSVPNVVKSHEFTSGTPGNYSVGYENGTLTMKKASVDITITAEDDEWTYDGETHKNTTVTVTSGSLLAGDTLVATATGSVTNVADTTTDNNPIAAGYKIMHGTEDVTENYNITTEAGTLTINPKAVTVKAQDKAFTYTGEAQSWPKYDVDGLVGDDAITAVVTGSITFPSQSPVTNELTSYEFTKGTPGNYSVTTANGELTMTEAETAITITAASQEWTYDGESHKNTEVTVTSGSLLSGDTLVATATGSVTDVTDTTTGNNPIAEGYKIMHGDEDVTANYAITPVAGTLTINPKAVTVTAKSEEFTYDGTAHSNSGYDVTGLVGEDAISAVVTGSITFPSESPVTNKLESYEFTKGIAGNYSVTTADGKLTMETASVAITITAGDGEWPYDGQAHSNATVTVTEGSLLTGDRLVAEATGSVTHVSQTEEGNNPVADGYKIMHGNEDVTANYTITTEAGTLAITPVELTITAGSAEKVYDGSPLTKNSYTNTALVVGDIITGITITGSQTDVGHSDNVPSDVEITRLGLDVTSNYTIVYAKGSLDVTPRPVTVTARSEEFTYDGTAHSNSGYDVDGLVGDDAISAVVTGSITFPSESPVTNKLESYEFTTGNPDNYSITTADGKLTMKKAEVAITITAGDGEWPYDGQAHSNATVTVTSGELLEGDELVATATGSVTNVADTAEGNNPIAAGYKIMHGEEDVTANYVITPEAGKLTINPKAVTVTAKSEEFTYDGTTHTWPEYNVDGLVGDDAITAVVEGSITFPSESPVDNVVKSHEVTTGTAGNYTVSYENGKLTMKKAEVEITITAASQGWTYDGTPHSNTAVTVTSGELFEGDELVAEATGSVTNVADTADGNNPIAEGYKIMHGDEDVTANYAITPVAGTLTINPKAVTVTAQDKAFAYDGSAHSWPEYDVEGLVGEDAITAVLTGSITFPRESPVTNKLESYEFTKGTPGNYDVTTKDGQLTMTKAEVEITITAASQEWTYDGGAHSNATVTVTSGSLLSGDTLVATATGSVTNVADTSTGNNPIAEGYKIMHGDEEVTDNYAITPVAGTLTINPKAVTVTAKSEGFTYDGTVHSNSGYDVKGLVGEDAISAVVTGSITFPSQSPVTNKLESYEFTEGTPGNYSVTTADGELTMTNAEVEITITAASQEWTYDGESHENTEVTVTSGSLLTGDELVAEATGSVTNVADTATGNNPIAEGYKIMHGEEDVTANYVITPEAGKLTINPKAVTVTAKSEEFTYDGTAHSNSGYDVTGLVGADAISAVVTGSITFPSESPVTNKLESYEFTTGTPGNYDVTTKDGQLTMTNAEVEITITAASQEWTYDGESHENTEVTVTSGSLLAGDELVAEATGSVTNVADTAEGNNPIAAGYKIMHGDEDVTGNYNITTEAGKLTIKPAAVTITAQDKAFAYDGSAHSWPEYDVTGLVGEDAISAVVTGSITFPSESPVTNKLASYEFTTGTPGNYSVTTADGELTMTNAEVEITITAASQEWTYDGESHENTEVTVTSGELLTGDELVAEATGSVTNVADTATGNNPIAAGYKIMHGDEDVTANYAITTVDGTLTINPKAVTVTAKSEEFTYDGNAHSNSGYDVEGLVGEDAISAVVTGSITFPSESPVTNKLTSYEFTTGTAGNYSVTTADGQLTMKNASAAITITAASQEWTYDGSVHTNTEVTVTSGLLLTGDRLVAEATGSVKNVADTATGNNPIAAGYKIMHGDEDVTASYVITAKAGTLTINPKAVTITAQDKAFTYTGEAQSWPEYDVTGLVGDDAISAVVTGSITFPSESPVTNKLESYEFTKGTAGNYDVTTEDGQLTMTNASVAITITAASQEWTYDGTAHTNKEVTVTSGSLLEGDELVAEATGSVTNVADTTANNNPIAEGYKIMHGDEDVTANYAITTKAGTLTINPKAVTVTAQDKEFTYTGEAQSWNKYDVDGLVGEDAISAVVTGSITFPSESPVTNKLTSYEFTTGKPGNYSVTTADGKLTMKKAEVAITITAASQEWTYDGESHENTEVTVTKGELLTRDELVAEATGSVKNVADTATGNNPIAEGYKIMHGNEDVTANYVITTEAGTLTINPKAVTVTAQDKEFIYTGEAQSWNKFDVEGLVEDDAISAVVTGSITFPSESPVTNKLESYEFTKGTAGNYTVTTKDGKLTMTNASAAITITAASQEWTYDGSAHTNKEVKVTEGELLPGDTLVAEATGSVKNVADTATGNNPIAEGYKIMHGNEDVSANYNITTEAGTLTIKPAAVTVTAKSEEFTYDGTAHSNSGYDVEGLVGEDAISAVVTGSITFPSESPVTNKLESYEFTKGTPGNYTVTTENGELSMKKAEVAITITAASQEWTYDGSAHTNKEVTVTKGELLTEDELVAEATGSVKNVADTAEGNNPIAEGYKIMHGEEDVTANYVITTEAGTLTIKPAAVTITAQDKAFAYDGSAHTWPEYDVTGLIGDDAISAVVTGSITFPSESPVTNKLESYEFTEGTPGNYDVTTKDGQLTMTNAEVEITITAASQEWTYDGNAHSNNTVTVTSGELLEGDELVAEATGSVKNVADTAEGNNPIAEGYKIMHGDEDVTANYAITTVDGTLTINPKAVTVTAKSEEFTYDGTAHSNSGYDVEGLVGEDAITAVVTGSITFPSESPVTNKLESYEFTKGTPGNYDVTTKGGQLTMKKAEVAITITAASQEWTYDGSAHTNKEVTVTKGELLTGDELLATATGSVKNVADTAEGNNPIAEGYKIMHGEEDVTANYKITTVDGTLTINPKAVTVTAKSEEFTYDGTAHSNPGYDVEGLVGEDAIEAVVTGSITFPSESPVTNKLASYEFTTGTPGNYTVTTEDGQLTIKKAEVAITITAASQGWTYDGTAHSNNTVTVTSGKLLAGDELVAEATGSVKNVADTEQGNNPIKTGYKIMHGDEDVTANYKITPVDGTLSISKRSVTLTSADDKKVYDGTALTNDKVTVSGDGFVEGEGATYDVTGTITEVGETPNTFTYTLNNETDANNYDINKVEGTLTITEFTEKVTVTITEHSGSEKYDGNQKSVTGYDVSIDNKLYTEADFEFSGSAVVNGTDAGTYEMKLKPEDFMNISENFSDVDFIIVDGTLEISKRSVTLTSADDSKEYDGTALTNDEVTVTGDGFATGEGATYDVTGTITNVGETPNAFTYKLNENTKEANYEITKTEGTLKITAVTDEVIVTITENSGSEKYDGEEKTVTGYEVTEISNKLYTEGDFTFSGNDTVKGTDAGSYPMELKPADFTNTNKNFSKVTFVIVDGTLEISKRSVTLTSADDEKVYDGKALTNDEVTVTGDGFAEGEGATYDVTGTQTEVGSSKNAFTYKLNEGTNADNYTITPVEGTLEVTAVTDKVTVTITENSGKYKYDGSEKAVTGYDLSIDNELYTEDDFTFSGDATVKGTDAGTYEMELKASDFTNISKNFSNVEFVIVDGTLEISKRTVIMTSATDSKVYDGKALTNDTVTETGDGFIDGEGATYDVTGSQTRKGSSKNTFTYELNEGTKASNYDITKVEGTLTVTELTDKVTVTITEHSGSEKYDGSEKTVTGYDVSIDNELYTKDDFTFSGDATVKGTDAGSYEMELKASDFTNTNDDFSNVEFVIVDGKLEISKRTVVMTSADDEKVYDKTPLTNDKVTVTGDGFAEGEGATYDVTGTRTEVGTSQNTFAYKLNDNTKGGNYEITTNYGTLKVTPVTEKVTVTITEHSDTAEYDGEEHVVTGYDVSIDSKLYDESDFTFNGDATVKGTDAGTYEMKLKASDFTNTNTNFSEVEFVIVDGTLEITKKQVTVTADDKTKVYGTDDPSLTATVEGTIGNDKVLYDLEREPGENVGTYKITFVDSAAVQGNYTVVFVDGTFEITPVTDKVTVTITEHSGSEKYDGEEKTVTGYDVDIDNKLYTEKDFSFSGDATVKGTDAGSYGMELKASDFANTSKNFTNVEFVIVDGTLEISKRTVTLTSADDEKVYDGKPLTNDEVTVGGDGFADGEGAAYDVTGTITDTGETPNTFTYKLNEGTKAGNYEITTVEGTLKITPVTDKVTVTITEHSDTAVYDGKEHTVSGYDVDISNKLYTENDFSFSGNDTVKGTNAGTYEMELKPEDFTNNSKNFTNIEFVIVDGTLEISKKEITVTVTGHDGTATYDGKEHTVSGYDVEISDPLYTEKDFTFSGDDTAKGTDAGTYEKQLKESDFKNNNDNFDVTFVADTKVSLEIEKLNVTVKITGNSDSAVYDGKEHTVSGYEAEISDPLYTKDDIAISGKAEAKGTDAGTYEMGLKEDQFSNKNDNFTVEFSVEDGSLKITPAEITDDPEDPDDPSSKRFDVTDPEDTVYNGKEQKQPVTITDKKTGKTLVEGKDFTITYSDDVTNVGEVTVTIKGIGNYSGEITRTYNILPAEVLIVADDKEITYGDKLPKLTATVTGLIGDDILDYDLEIVERKVKLENAGKYTIQVDLKEQDLSLGTTSTIGNYTVTTQNGTLTINRAPLRVWTDSAAKRFDGTALTNVLYHVTGLRNGDKIKVDVTGSQTQVGSSRNTFTINWGKTEKNNYDLTREYGTLTVRDGGGNGPVPPVINPVVGPAPAPIAPAVIDDEPTPQEAPEVEPVTPEETPQTVNAYWALINLICTILTVVLSLLVLVFYLGKRKKDADEDENEDRAQAENEDEEDQQKTIKKKGLLRIMDIIPAVVAVITFILTEDMSLPMQLVDKWTLLMVVILLVDAVVAIFTKKKVKDADEDEEEAQPEQ